MALTRTTFQFCFDIRSMPASTARSSECPARSHKESEHTPDNDRNRSRGDSTDGRCTLEAAVVLQQLCMTGVGRVRKFGSRSPRMLGTRTAIF